jgi:hypothetical protein
VRSLHHFSEYGFRSQATAFSIQLLTETGKL